MIVNNPNENKFAVTFRKRNDEETDIEGSVIFSFNLTATKIKMKDPVEVNVEKANSNGHGVERDIKMANAEERTSLSVVSSTVDSMRSSSSSLAKSESSQDTPVSVLNEFCFRVLYLCREMKQNETKMRQNAPSIYLLSVD